VQPVEAGSEPASTKLAGFAFAKKTLAKHSIGHNLGYI